ncbi:MAG TPA: hypothetical protein VGE52_05345, partial [Pirellulales bacterium]
MIRTFEILAVVLLLAVFSGCGQPAAPPAAVPQTNVGEHHHSGWWCAEHGVPEEICARCSSTVAADFQKK